MRITLKIGGCMEATCNRQDSKIVDVLVTYKRNHGHIAFYHLCPQHIEEFKVNPPKTTVGRAGVFKARMELVKVYD